MNKKIINHFKAKDPILYKTLQKIVEKKMDNNLFVIGDSKDLFVDLIETIINQQLSDKAAATIFSRFKKLFPKGKITPQKILKLKDEQIRIAGTSYGKIIFMKDLSSKVLSKELILENLKSLDDEQIIIELTKVKGIGRWTAEMFLMFSLGKEDIFSHGDLGLNNAIVKLYGLNKPTKEDVMTITNKWIPYRTYACRILWRSLDI